jgi:hypothetical protein
MKNGNGTKRQQVFKARQRILREALRTGHITNAKARKVGRFDQAWFHLQSMVDDGTMKYSGFNRWTPTKRGRSQLGV